MAWQCLAQLTSVCQVNGLLKLISSLRHKLISCCLSRNLTAALTLSKPIVLRINRLIKSSQTTKMCTFHIISWHLWSILICKECYSTQCCTAIMCWHFFSSHFDIDKIMSLSEIIHPPKMNVIFFKHHHYKMTCTTPFLRGWFKLKSRLIGATWPAIL